MQNIIFGLASFLVAAFAFLSAMNTFLKEAGYEPKTIYEAMKRTAGRPLNNSCQIGTNLRTDKK